MCIHYTIRNIQLGGGPANRTATNTMATLANSKGEMVAQEESVLYVSDIHVPIYKFKKLLSFRYSFFIIHVLISQRTIYKSDQITVKSCNANKDG